MALHYGKNVLIIGGVNSSNLPIKRMEGVSEETENLVKDMCTTINNSRLDRVKEELIGETVDPLNHSQVKRVADVLNKYIVEAAKNPKPLQVGDKWSSNLNGVEITHEITEINGEEMIITRSFIPPHPVMKVYIDPSKFKELMGKSRYKITFAIRKNGKHPIVFANSRKNYNTPVIK